MTSIEAVVSVEYYGGANVEILNATGTAIDKFREESGFAFVEPEFFDVFDFKDTDFKWLYGNPRASLVNPLSIVLTRSMALKYFGKEDVVGQTLRLQRKHECKVTGVISDLPANTDFPFTCLISYSTLEKFANEGRLADWYSVNDSHHSFLVLPRFSSVKELEKQIARIHTAHTPKDLHESRHFRLQRLEEMHHDERFRTFSGRMMSKQIIVGLSIVSIFLLLAGSINYINLATAQSTLRSKEVGVRKVMGSDRRSLIAQYLIETFLIVFAATAMAVLLSEVLLVNMQSLLNLPRTGWNFMDPEIVMIAVAVIIILTFLSGFYPAFVLSQFNPIVALKNTFLGGRVSGVSLRKVLVVFQFAITQILVVATFIVVLQMDYFQNSDMGFNREGIINARVPVRDPETLQTMENKLRSLSYVDDVAFSYTLPGGVRRNHHYNDIARRDATERHDYHVYEYVSIDEAFLDLYGISLLAGRNLELRDSVGNIIINETLCRNLGLGTPPEAIGAALKMSDGTPVNVVGVVADYFSNSMKEAPDNIVMVISPENYAAVGVKINILSNSESMTGAIRAIGKIWTETFPDYVFNYQFLDENIAAYYQQEEKYSILFKCFSLIFLLIGALGLYGLISFVVNRKGKEIAIRKVLGATVNSILAMFSREYIVLIVLSFVVGCPIALYAVKAWLSNFENQIELRWYLFAIPGISIMIFALLIITTKSLGAALSNPVDKIKHE